MDASFQPIPLSESVLMWGEGGIFSYSISLSLSLSHSPACSLSRDLDSIRVLPGAVKERSPCMDNTSCTGRGLSLVRKTGRRKWGKGKEKNERERNGLERRHEIFSAAVESVSGERHSIIYMQFK